MGVKNIVNSVEAQKKEKIGQAKINGNKLKDLKDYVLEVEYRHHSAANEEVSMRKLDNVSEVESAEV